MIPTPGRPITGFYSKFSPEDIFWDGTLASDDTLREQKSNFIDNLVCEGHNSSVFPVKFTIDSENIPHEMDGITTTQQLGFEIYGEVNGEWIPYQWKKRKW